MTDIVLLTRDPAQGGNNWVAATQEMNPQTNTPWRYIAFGKGRGQVKGSSVAEVDTDLSQYIANRVSNGYVEQVRVKIYFPMQKIIAFAIKHLPKVLSLMDSIRVKPSTSGLPPELADILSKASRRSLDPSAL